MSHACANAMSTGLVPLFAWALDTFLQIPDYASSRFFPSFVRSSVQGHVSNTEYGIIELKFLKANEMMTWRDHRGQSILRNGMMSDENLMTIGGHNPQFHDYDKDATT